MSFIELALRAYIVVSALPVLGFVVVLLVDVSAANKEKRRNLHHSDPVL
ncbi:MAG TPA: hypothetical protein VGO37_19845 [Steroidobacteraceae bacterium]|jgi:hypothetical protein|nr:hypothetical protein [Steroidobacteraceae bacterium]